MLVTEMQDCRCVCGMRRENVPVLVKLQCRNTPVCRGNCHPHKVIPDSEIREAKFMMLSEYVRWTKPVKKIAFYSSSERKELACFI